jgi:hypothetical protein
LCKINTALKEEIIPWEEIKTGISECLAERGGIGMDISAWDLYVHLRESLAERCSKWQKTFRHLFDEPGRYAYDHTEWRRIALAPNVRPDPYFDLDSSDSAGVPDDTWENWKQQTGYQPEGAEWSRGLWDDWRTDYNWSTEFEYDERDLQWDEWAHNERRFERLEFPLKPNFPDSLWVHFHRAALLQRHVVVELLP